MALCAMALCAIVAAYALSLEAADDYFVMARDHTVEWEILENDRAANPRWSAVELDSTGTQGRASVDGAGNLHYTPSAGFLGYDELRYSIRTRWGVSDSAVVGIQVIEAP